jgi:isoquinoline 1-oxidoreductase subunit beta
MSAAIKTDRPAVNRRAFLVASAGVGLTLGLGWAPQAEAAVAAQAAPGAPELNAWVVISPDDTVTVRIARSEMGQGTLTGLAQLVAEELQCDWAKVTCEYASPQANITRSRVWGSMSTGGSRGIRDSHELVRKGGAAARMMLVQAAATGWGVPASECAAAEGVVTHSPSQRKARFGELVAAAAKLPVPAAADVPLKDPKTWRLVGKRLPRLDTVEKVTGAQIYGADLSLPGMLNAAIKACPVHGGKLVGFDATAIANRPGVRAVLKVDDTAVAVVADTWWRAHKALEALPITWDEGAGAKVGSADTAAILKAALDAPEAAVGTTVGDAKAALAKSARRIEAVYAYPHQNHACMEPMNATARFTPAADGKPGRCEVWAPTQNGDAALAATAESAGLPPAQCEVYKLHLGGGFGRRGATDYVRQAVSLAKQLPGVPVKLLWSREEDMAQGLFHPVTQCKLTAGLDAKGQIEALHMRIAGQSILASVAPQRVTNGLDPVVFQGLTATGAEGSIGYTIPNLLVDHAMRNPHVRPGFWRGVNLNQNAMYLECFLDEIAHATKQDPLALRRQLMAQHPKHLAVLDAVAQRVGWGKPAARIDGATVHRGLAQIMGFGSYVAACAEVSVTAKGELKIHRIVAATDCGTAVNPQQIEAQVEGSFAYGLSTLYSACTVANGRIEQSNLHDYPPLKLQQMPKVETIILASGGFWGGVGEPTIAVAVPAVLNAVFAATGQRIRELPMKLAAPKAANTAKAQKARA